MSGRVDDTMVGVSVDIADAPRGNYQLIDEAYDCEHGNSCFSCKDCTIIELQAEVRRLREENETLRALRDELFERLKPKPIHPIHSCDIPGCISCGNPPDDKALRGGEEAHES